MTLLASGASVANVARAQSEELQGAAALSAAQARLSDCEPLVPLPSTWHDDDGPQMSFRYEEREGGGLARFADSGSGVDAEGSGWELWIGADCAQAVREWTYSDGDLFTRARFRRTDDAPEAARAVLGETGDASNPAHAFAAFTLALVHPWWCMDDLHPLEGACPEPVDGVAVCAPEGPAQPWFPGPPQGSPALFWPGDCDDPAFTGEGEVNEHPEAGAVCGRSTGLHPGPDRSGTLGPHERWEAQLSGRNRGVAVAEMDVEQNRHRWVMASRGCVNGTRLRWLGEGSGIAVGEARSVHPRYGDSLFAIALEEGTVRRIDIENAWVGDDWDRLDLEEGVEVDETFWAPRVEGSALVLRSLDRTERRIELADLAARVLGPASPEVAAPESTTELEPPPVDEYGPLDEALRAEQRVAGLRGLAIWGTLGVIIALGLFFTWGRKPR